MRISGVVGNYRSSDLERYRNENTAFALVNAAAEYYWSLPMKEDLDTHPHSLDRKVLYGLANWALLVAGLANLCAGTLAAFHGLAAIAATSLTGGLALLFAATIDRFESLKGLGVEAKTKKLDRKIVQADEALRRLREMTEITGAALIDMHSKMGKWDSMPSPRESIALADRVRHIMRRLGSDQAVIEAVLRPWAKGLCRDMANELVRPLFTRAREVQSKKQEILGSQAIDEDEIARLTAEIREIDEFCSSRTKRLDLLQPEDYPEKFMEIFADFPYGEPADIDHSRTRATKFLQGMVSLRECRTPSDSELWIDTLTTALNK